MTRWRLDIAYDGTAFAGWARQADLRTVQGVLEDALARITGDVATLTCAGRTDAGVHARGQVAHVDLADQPGDRDGESFARQLRGVLPADVTVRRAMLAPEHFDARFAALSRRYRYLVCDDPSAMDPLRRHDVLEREKRLDIQAMNAAAALLVGEHDFAALCKQREHGTTIRRILSLRWDRTAEGWAAMEVSADAFCHSMVRSLVGLFVPIGEGRQSPEWAAEVVAGRVRDSRVTVMPARGLTLEEVVYPPDDQLLARQQLTRTVRTLEG